MKLILSILIYLVGSHAYASGCGNSDWYFEEVSSVAVGESDISELKLSVSKKGDGIRLYSKNQRPVIYSYLQDKTKIKNGSAFYNQVKMGNYAIKQLLFENALFDEGNCYGGSRQGSGRTRLVIEVNNKEYHLLFPAITQGEPPLPKFPIF